MDVEVLLTNLRKPGELVESEFKTEIVVYADLCDSTSYKAENREGEGVWKVGTHNVEATRVFREAGAGFQKWAGDAVIACFDTSGPASGVLNAAIQLIERLEEINQDQRLSEQDQIRTKIGISVGRVLLLPVRNLLGVDDVHGSAVDLAFRLSSIAMAQQILVDARVKAHGIAGLVSAYGKTQRWGSDDYFRDFGEIELKGVANPTRTSELLWGEARQIAEPQVGLGELKELHAVLGDLQRQLFHMGDITRAAASEGPAALRDVERDWVNFDAGAPKMVEKTVHDWEDKAGQQVVTYWRKVRSGIDSIMGSLGSGDVSRHVMDLRFTALERSLADFFAWLDDAMAVRMRGETA